MAVDYRKEWSDAVDALHAIAEGDSVCTVCQRRHSAFCVFPDRNCEGCDEKECICSSCWGDRFLYDGEAWYDVETV